MQLRPGSLPVYFDKRDAEEGVESPVALALPRQQKELIMVGPQGAPTMASIKHNARFVVPANCEGVDEEALVTQKNVQFVDIPNVQPVVVQRPAKAPRLVQEEEEDDEDDDADFEAVDGDGDEDDFVMEDFLLLVRQRTSSSSEWVLFEDADRLTASKMGLPKGARIPVCLQSLEVEKRAGKVGLTRLGEEVDLQLVCPAAFQASSLLLRRDACTALLDSVFVWANGRTAAAAALTVPDHVRAVTAALDDVVGRLGTADDRSSLGFLKEQLLQMSQMVS